MNKDNNLRMVVQEIEPLQKKDLEEAPEHEVKPSGFPRLKFLKRQLFAAIAVSWVSLIIGYSSAFSAPAEHSIKRDFNLQGDSEISWMSSFMPLGALIGGLGGGSLIEYIGRKWTILLTNILFFVAWFVCYFAQNYIYLYIGRILSGVSVGIASLTLPVYTAETLQPEVRGSLGLLSTVLGNIGILICFSFGIYYEWKGLSMIGVLLCVPFMVMIWFIPETPKFLLAQNDEAKARKALQWLRGAKTDVEKEFVDMQKFQKETANDSENLLVLFKKKNMKLLGIELGLMFFQQFSGINGIIFYITGLFDKSGSNINADVCTTIVGVVNFAATFVASMLIDRLGRKVLLYISSVSMAISLAVLGLFFYLKDVVLMDLHSVDWLPLVCFMTYVLGFSLGFGPIPWLMLGEILPAKIRGPAASISTAFSWTCTFVVTKTSLYFIDTIGAHYTFWMYGFIVCCSLLFSIFIVPETKGFTLADIERKLTGVKVRRISSLANIKPTPSFIG
ncbi:unnamed protein product [Phyllotreta striolata]|uniref:Major facilitator superfamily (MFS) profile domain-containing protein n=1 Tax=Phyllotreta striolata TaxID=444603 RepID=A0A9P0GMN4_PHYSR|nr:unnamed protein product [Phyllotreta striolata]